MNIFLLFHMIDEQDESLKIIGVFSTLEAAESARELVRIRPGFSEVGEFYIDEYDLDMINWREGFIV